MNFFKRTRRPKASTRIVTKVNVVPGTTPRQAMVSAVVQTARWESRGEEFRGFDSPPGRF
jgi:hypothetical protein